VKHKTLFRLAVKIVGVFLIATTLIELPWTVYTQWSSIVQLTSRPAWPGSPSGSRPWLYAFQGSLRAILALAMGLYLFFGGEWIVNKAIPSNRPYCHECGYMLKNLTGNTCPECDTPFRPEPPATPPTTS
jgi:hypothetical protein